jgi:SSS family solute:Na+ symporter
MKIGDNLLWDLGDWNFTHHKYMLGVYTHIIVLVVGYFASFFFKSKEFDKELTIHEWIGKGKKS